LNRRRAPERHRSPFAEFVEDAWLRVESKRDLWTEFYAVDDRETDKQLRWQVTSRLGAPGGALTRFRDRPFPTILHKICG
jgi:hypothetical protein